MFKKTISNLLVRKVFSPSHKHPYLTIICGKETFKVGPEVKTPQVHITTGDLIKLIFNNGKLDTVKFA